MGEVLKPSFERVLQVNETILLTTVNFKKMIKSAE